MSVAAESASAVGADVDGGRVVVVVVVVLVGGTVVVGVVVVVGGTVVVAVVVGGTVVVGVGERVVVVGSVALTDSDGVELTGAVGVGVAPNWSAVFAGPIGGVYPQPDSTVVLETLIVEITFGPLFKRS